MGRRVYLLAVERGATVAASSALEAVFKPVQPPTTFEETVERLGTAIRLGLLPPGSRLPAERDLAEQLRISRSTLRQALTTLVQSGHLVSVRGRAGGTFVSEDPPLSGESPIGGPLDEEARAVLDMRVALETGAVLLAVERADQEDLARLDELVDGMDGAPSFEEYRRADVRFHIGVAEAARSPGLVTAMTEMQGRMSELIARISHPEEVLSRSNAQHRRLLTLVRNREASRAVRLMRDHLEGTEHILVGLMPDGSVGSRGA
jgi:GntR family transcriptional repressor for pyruvate dehydrogenase complex